jgi:hypothetical protein
MMRLVNFVDCFFVFDLLIYGNSQLLMNTRKNDHNKCDDTMETQQKLSSAVFEQALITIVRTLPPRRAAQVLDFARWLQTQPAPDKKFEEELTPDELEREEKAWEQVYMANRDHFREMAREALKDLEAGETLEMVIENGKIAAR